MSRFFADATASTVGFLEALNHRFNAGAVSFTQRQPRLIVDVDTRDVPVYGKQEGSTASPRADGDRIYTFEAVTLRNGRRSDGGCDPSRAAVWRTLRGGAGAA